VKSGPAKSKKAKKTRALLLAGILVLAVIAGGLVLLKPATKGWATAEECSECAGYNEAVDAANNAMLEVWKNMDERVALSTFFSNYNSALDDSIINDDSISMPCKQGLMAFQNIAVQSMTSPSLTSSIEFYNEKAYALQSKLDKLPPRGKCRGEEDLKAMQSLAEELRALAAQIPDTDVHSQRRSNFDNAVSNWLDKCNDLNSQDEATINTLIREVG